MCKSVKTTQQLPPRQLPINILLLPIPPQLDSQKFYCLNSNLKGSSSPLLQYFFPKLLLHTILLSQKWAMGIRVCCGNYPHPSSSISSESLNSVVGILQMWPEPSRRGFATNIPWSAPSSSGHNMPETIQIRGTLCSTCWLCKELRNINRRHKEHNPEHSAGWCSLTVVTESTSSKIPFQWKITF